MLKNLISVIAVVSFLAACSKNSDNGSGAKSASTQEAEAPVLPGDSGEIPQSAADENQKFGRYTGTADDYLREIKTNEFEIKTADAIQKQNEIAKAREIISASLESSGKKLNLTLVLQKANEARKVIVLSGLDSTEKSITLKQSRDEQRVHTQESAVRKATFVPEVQATLVCHDLKSADKSMANCGNKIATISFGEKARSRQVVMILRTTSAHFHVRFPEGEFESEAFKNLVYLFKNSEFNLDRKNQIKSLILDSVEVINGRSLMTLTLSTYEKQTLKLQIPMKLVRDEADSIQVENVVLGKSKKTSLADSLAEVRLVQNLGRGEITLSLEVKDLRDSTANLTYLKLIRDRREISVD